jgi:hypothetical protein
VDLSNKESKDMINFAGHDVRLKGLCATSLPVRRGAVFAGGVIQ